MSSSRSTFDNVPPRSPDAEPSSEKDVKPTTLRRAPVDAASSSSQLERAPGTLPANQVRLLPPIRELPAFAVSLTVKAVKATGRGLAVAGSWTAGAVKTMVTEPKVAWAKTREIWDIVKHEAHHYWVGSKLLVAEVRTSTGLLRKLGSGSALTRRERLQLKRTLGDIARMVPFIIIVIIPFAELGLPVLLKLFPNMLPSQFEKAEVRQEAYKRSLNARLELHGILQEILEDRAKTRAETEKDPASGSAAQLLARLEAVRRGDRMPPDAVVAVARLFKDEVTTDTLPRGQLITLAKYMGISPFLPEVVLRAQLRAKLSEMNADDRLLASEGTGDMSKEELKAACEERGMRAVGLSHAQYRAQLDEWLDLSVRNEVPATLLLLSRGFQIASIPSVETGVGLANEAAAAVSSAAQVQGLQESISSIDPRTVKEALAQAATSAADQPVPAVVAHPEGPAASAGAPSPAEASAATAAQERKAARAAESTVLEAKLESLELQNQLIGAEREAAEAVAASEKAAAVARESAAAVSAAEGDPGRAGELQALQAAAQKAAAKAQEKAKLAEAKTEAFIRLRAVDATRAAATMSSQAPATLAQQAASTPLTPAEEASLLAAVASRASMGREKRLLERLKAAQARLDAQEALQRGRIAQGAGSAQASTVQPPAAEDRTAALIRQQLASLQAGMEADIAARSASLKASLASADADKDSLVDKDDLSAMLASLLRLKGQKAEDAAAALIKRLDQDGDGHITLAALDHFLDTMAGQLASEEAKAASKNEADRASSGSESEEEDSSTKASKR